MALRSALRKMPALGRSSLPFGPRMGPVRALSPAAPSRNLSQGNFPSATRGKKTCGQGQVDSSREARNQMLAEYNKDRLDVSNNLAECDKIMEKIHQRRAVFPEIMRRYSKILSIRVNKRVNTFVAAHCGASALLVIATMYRHSSNC